MFRSTKGLVLVAIALISLVTAMWGMLSGPLKEWGISDFAARLYGMSLVESEREGRIILLYHTIAMAVVAIETYLITALVPMKAHQQATINATITFGYITSLVFGLWFGYFGHNFVFHGIHYRYLRGGSKANYGYNLRVWTRNNATPVYASPSVGFRCVREAVGWETGRQGNR